MLKEFETFLASKHHLDFGYVHQTPAYNLTNSQYVLHVRSPYFKKTHLDTNTSINEVIFYNLFRKAFIDLDLKTFVTPLIGTGHNKIDLIDCLNDFVDALFKFLSDFQTNANSPKSSLFNKAENVQHFPFSLLNKTVKRRVYIVNNDLNAFNLCCDVIEEKLNSIKKIKLEPSTTSPVAISSNPSSSEETCVICLDNMTKPKKLKKCSHEFCTECIDSYFKNVKQTCPICNTVYGIR